MSLLEQAGHKQPDLVAAALLHDVGKDLAKFSWWDRTIVVLGQRFFPNQSSKWATGEPRGWRRPFVVKAAHPCWGAKAASASGSSPLTVQLIHFHQDQPKDLSEHNELTELLVLLQWADDES